MPDDDLMGLIMEKFVKEQYCEDKSKENKSIPAQFFLINTRKIAAMKLINNYNCTGGITYYQDLLNCDFQINNTLAMIN